MDNNTEKEPKPISPENEKLIEEAEQNIRVSRRFLLKLRNPSKKIVETESQKREDLAKFIKDLKVPKE